MFEKKDDVRPLLALRHPSFDPWVPPKESVLGKYRNIDFPRNMFHENLFVDGWGLFLTFGAMKIESGVVSFIFGLWENIFLTCFRTSMFSVCL